MAEILHEIALEIGGDPGKFAIELVQFALLVAIVVLVARGVGKRKGLVVNMLAERRQRVENRVARAEHADEALEQARVQGAERIAAARAEATVTLREARANAQSRRRDLRAAADAEVEAIRVRAQAVLDEEFAEMHVEIRDRLVSLVAQATRSLLNEGLSPGEQRQLIQGVVAGGLDRLERSLDEAPAGGRTT